VDIKTNLFVSRNCGKDDTRNVHVNGDRRERNLLKKRMWSDWDLLWMWSAENCEKLEWMNNMKILWNTIPHGITREFVTAPWNKHPFPAEKQQF